MTNQDHLGVFRLKVVPFFSHNLFNIQFVQKNLQRPLKLEERSCALKCSVIQFLPGLRNVYCTEPLTVLLAQKMWGFCVRQSWLLRELYQQAVHRGWWRPFGEPHRWAQHYEPEWCPRFKFLNAFSSECKVPTEMGQPRSIVVQCRIVWALCTLVLLLAAMLLITALAPVHVCCSRSLLLAEFLTGSNNRLWWKWHIR